MVKIVNVHEFKTPTGTITSLELQGEVEMVLSHKTGRYYATVRKCYIVSNLKAEEAKGLVGKEIAGQIKKVACEPYEYTIPNTQEQVILDYNYTYLPEDNLEPMPAKTNHQTA